MFNNKQTQLFAPVTKASTKKATSSKSIKKTDVPAFVNAGLKKQAVTLSGNLAVKFKTTGNEFVDQFGKLGTYKAPRSYEQIAKDCEVLWGDNPLVSVKFMHYLRTIPRQVVLFNGDKTEDAQKGGELKHEPIFRMLWLSQKSPETFWKNIGLFVSLGSWHDIFTMLQYDLVYNTWNGRKLDWPKFGNLILTALENKNTCELVKKYLPQIKARSACKTVESQANTIIAKWICSLLFGEKETSWNYKKYRQLKTSGTAHEWQKLISTKKFDRIEFDKIHGRALNLLVRSKFLKNQGLSDKYSAWVTKPETKVKYTGFVHELFSKLPNSLSDVPLHEQTTINKQFHTLVEKGKTDGVTSLICVRDTSGSTGVLCTGTNTTVYNVEKALALYFSEFLHGKFANSWIEFNSDAQMHTWKGDSPLSKWYNDHSSFVGSTNFESVIHLFAKIKKQGIPESEFPTGILCLSDGEFNPASLGKTNVESALNILRRAGFSDEYVDNFVIVLWNLQSSYYGKGTGEKFETFGINTPNVFYFSGFSASTVSFLTNQKVFTVQELFDAAMDQQILNMVTL